MRIGKNHRDYCGQVRQDWFYTGGCLNGVEIRAACTEHLAIFYETKAPGVANCISAPLRYLPCSIGRSLRHMLDGNGMARSARAWWRFARIGTLTILTLAGGRPPD